MSQSIDGFPPRRRMIRLAAIAALTPLIVSGCDGDGNGGGVDADDDITILPTYGYQISASQTAGPLAVTLPDVGGDRIISVDFGNTLNGDVNIVVNANDEATVTDYTLRALSSAAVDSDAGAAFLGAFSIEVTEDMALDVGDPPSSGAFNVTTANETASLRAFGNDVEIRLDGGMPLTLTWDELENFVDDEQAFDWQRRTALAAEVLEFTFIQWLNIVETLNWVTDDLATTNPLVAPCDAFTGSPPAGVLAQGETTFTWIGSGAFPMSGDDFQWAFTDCWFDDVGDPEDQLLNGSLDLNDYVEVVDGQLNLIGIGYDDVVYNNLTVQGTVENPAGVFTLNPEDSFTINGGLDLAFIGTP